MPSLKLGAKMGGPFLTRQLWLKAGSWTMWRISGPSAREKLLAQGVRELPGWTLRVPYTILLKCTGVPVRASSAQTSGWQVTDWIITRWA